LLELISNAVCGYLRCSNSGYYLAESGGELTLQVERGRSFGNSFREILASVDSAGVPLMVWSDQPREMTFRQELLNLGLGSAIIVPVVRPRFRSVLYAARDNQEVGFQESDSEMFQILARQATAAMENARLYAAQLEYVRKIEDSQKALLQIEKMAAAGRLSASIAHEVNNPIHAVQNCLHLATRDDLPAEKQREYINLARVELERLAVTVQRMLAFYRPDPGAATRVNLIKILEHVLHLMSRQLTERGVKVELDFPRNLTEVYAVDSQLQQVFINLILNAFDAMPNGGTLMISARNQSKGVEIRFKDSGPGVPIAEQSRIFEPFFSSKEGGTGLGLTVSYNIITAHGGILELLSDQTKGACFRVFLPIGEKP
jgi:signal transduction histidine kinase